MSKWDVYYEQAERSSCPPPWESPEPFGGLLALPPSVLCSGMRAIELGCGSSASSAYMDSMGVVCTAVDICPLAIERAKRAFPDSKVDWLAADILDPSFVDTVTGNGDYYYDFVFDMQCFHVLRDVDEERCVQVISSCLRTNGHAMVVVGATTDERLSGAKQSGPPLLTRDQVLAPFLTPKGQFELVSIQESPFNSTHAYAAMEGGPPRCWVAVFRKVL